MNLADYQDLTGDVVASSDETRYQAQIVRCRRILETMLGFTLDPDSVDSNLYSETGKTATECPCPNVDTETLLDPDSVTFAYRLYSYDKRDKYLHIDPCTAIHKVKLVKDGITFRTFETYEFMTKPELDGIIKYLEVCDDCCTCSSNCENCVQLAVDATWLWDDEDDIPEDLKLVWADMVTFYADRKRNIKSETLGPHSYSRFDKQPPESEPQNMAVIQKYAGPLGSAKRNTTV